MDTRSEQPTDTRSIKQRINDASKISKDTSTIETEVWNSLPNETRDQLGRTRLRQMIAIELNDPDQLEFSIEGERFPLAEISPAVLERRGNRLITIGGSMIKRGQAYLDEAKRRTEEHAS
jgi:hypothetical protein